MESTVKTQAFPPDALSVTAARRFVSAALNGAAAEVQEAIVLMVSELATNCIKHVGREFEVSVTRGAAAVRVEVGDPSAARPVMRSPGPDDATGRGLRIVDMLSDTWGVRSRPHGKIVWFSVRLVSGTIAG